MRKRSSEKIDILTPRKNLLFPGNNKMQFDDLYNDVILHIYHFLDDTSKFLLSSTCVRMRQLSYHIKYEDSYFEIDAKINPRIFNGAEIKQFYVINRENSSPVISSHINHPIFYRYQSSFYCQCCISYPELEYRDLRCITLYDRANNNHTSSATHKKIAIRPISSISKTISALLMPAKNQERLWFECKGEYPSVSIINNRIILGESFNGSTNGLIPEHVHIIQIETDEEIDLVVPQWIDTILINNECFKLPETLLTPNITHLSVISKHNLSKWEIPDTITHLKIPMNLLMINCDVLRKEILQIQNCYITTNEHEFVSDRISRVAAIIVLDPFEKIETIHEMRDNRCYVIRED